MAFLAEIPELLAPLLEEGGVEGLEGSLLNNYTSFTNAQAGLANSNIQQLNQFGQQRAMQAAQNQFTDQQNQYALGSQQAMQLQDFNFRAWSQGQNQQQTQNLAEMTMAHQANMQTSGIVGQSDLMSQKFGEQSSLMNQAFSNNIKSNAIGAGVNLGGNLITAGINYLATSSLLKEQSALQRQNFDYTTGKAVDAYQQAGLPAFLAYGGAGAAMKFPNQTQTIAGNNVYTSSIPGNQTSMLWTGSSAQMAYGAGDIPSAY